MNLRNALYFCVSLVLTAGIALAQQGAPVAPTAPAAPPEADMPGVPAPPDTPPGAFSFFVSGGSFLGVYAEDINKENMSRYGMREVRGVGITQVVKDSPAEKAGLRKDDVIVKFEGESVTSTRKLNRLVSEVAPDQTARLTISRGGGEQEVAVTVGKRNNSFNTMDGFEGLEKLKGLDRLKDMEKNMPPGARVWKWEGEPGKDGVFMFGARRRIGVNTSPLTKQLAEYFGVTDGVLVSSVADDSPAAKAGIKAGDVITACDGEKVEGGGDLSRAINKKKDGDVTLTIVRNKNQRTINVTPKDDPNVPMTPQGRTIVIPRVELGEIPEMSIQIPRIELPDTPEIKVVVPNKIKVPNVKVIRTGTSNPI
ncbi:MAG TPA: PDZ domain-containing protein [Pyrinomonadaceae bacterium]|nr:PDZ domain-containing protein [Pyrinomonadaceae bacterium]